MIRWLRDLAFTLAVLIGSAFIALAVVIGEPDHQGEPEDWP